MSSMLKKALSLVGFVTLFGVCGWGQNKGDTEYVPQAPYIAKLPKFAHYEIRFEYGAGAKKETGLSRLSITKLNEIKNIVEIFGDGASKTFWLRRGLVVLPLPGSRAEVYDTEAAAADVPLSNDDFTGLGWLSAANYVGNVSFEGRKCYAFEHGGQQALIDVVSKLPVLLKTGNLLGRFEYGPAPSETATWPAEFEQAWQRYLGAVRSMTGTSGPR